MQKAGVFRPLIVLLILLFSLFMIWQTAYYFLLVEQGLSVEEQKEYRKNHLNLLSFGLDLIGGGEALFEVDEAKTVQNKMEDFQRQILDRFKQEPIYASLNVKGDSLLLQLQDEQFVANAASILNKSYSHLFTWDENALKNTQSTVLTLKPGERKRLLADALDSAYKAVETRLTVYGLEQPTVMKQGDARLLIQIPGVTTIDVDDANAAPGDETTTKSKTSKEAVFKNLVRPAQLEFRILHKKGAWDPDPREADLIRELIQDDYQREKLGEGKTHGEKIKFSRNPITKKFEPPLKPGKTKPLGYEFLPGYTSEDNQKYATWFLVRDTKEMTGEHLVGADQRFNPSKLGSPHYVSLEFDPTGASQFRRVTKDNLNERMAVVLDSIVYSAPNIKVVISTGQAIIEGRFSYDEVRELAMVLKAGSLPAPLNLIFERTIAPTLGGASIVMGVTSLLIGALCVIIFMTIYYGWAGLMADIAVVMNVIVVIAVLAMGRATLTLSGIAGLLLTVGMAVDANVLIYERIREELKLGKAWRLAIQNGFDKAFWTIFDANLTTMITALVLYHFGVGSVRGFAVTMTIGIIITLYTGLFVTRVLIELTSSTKGVNVGKIQIVPDNTEINFLGLRYGAYIVSLLLICVGIGAIVKEKGLLVAVDFSGGVQAEVVLNLEGEMNSEELRQRLTAANYPKRVKPTRIKGPQNKWTIRSPLIEDENGDESVNLTEENLRDALTRAFGDQGFEAAQHIIRVDKIGSEVGGDFAKIAIRAVIVAALCILIYVGFRFQFSFGVAAVIALFHDLFITISMLMVFQVEISLEVVAALLVVMGYSLNDTIVIFDRIRETLRTSMQHNYESLLNGSICRCLNRTLITSVTTLLTTLILLWKGGEALSGFAATLTIGIIVGTYSSSFVATPLLYEWQKRRRPEEGAAATSVAKPADGPAPGPGRKPNGPVESKKSHVSKGSMAAGRARKIDEQ